MTTPIPAALKVSGLSPSTVSKRPGWNSPAEAMAQFGNRLEQPR